MLTCTESAAKHIFRQLASRPTAIGLRIGVRTSGCSGLAYTLDLCDEVRETDKVFEAHGAKIIVNAKDLIFLSGTEIDFTHKGLSESFEFRNPQEVAKCGCGESFTVG
jgi:iron-sulfur cluster assembly protein